MKNLLLILTLTGALSLSVVGEEEIRDKENKIEEVQTNTQEVEKLKEKDLSQTFVAAFGMSESENKEVSTGMAAVSATAVNHVTPPFTPHIPK